MPRRRAFRDELVLRPRTERTMQGPNVRADRLVAAPLERGDLARSAPFEQPAQHVALRRRERPRTSIHVDARPALEPASQKRLGKVPGNKRDGFVQRGRDRVGADSRRKVRKRGECLSFAPAVAARPKRVEGRRVKTVLRHRGRPTSSRNGRAYEGAPAAKPFIAAAQDSGRRRAEIESHRTPRGSRLAAARIESREYFGQHATMQIARRQRSRSNLHAKPMRALRLANVCAASHFIERCGDRRAVGEASDPPGIGWGNALGFARLRIRAHGVPVEGEKPCVVAAQAHAPGTRCSQADGRARDGATLACAMRPGTVSRA